MCAGMPDRYIPKGMAVIRSPVYSSPGYGQRKSTRRHVKIHRDQWHYNANQTGYWFTFPILYAAAGSNVCKNRFEIAAGPDDGRYVC